MVSEAETRLHSSETHLLYDAKAKISRKILSYILGFTEKPSTHSLNSPNKRSYPTLKLSIQIQSQTVLSQSTASDIKH